MDHLKSKASQLFKINLSQDEEVEKTSSGQDAGYDTGIERSLHKKSSRFFRKQDVKSLPASPPLTRLQCDAPPLVSSDDAGGGEGAAVHTAEEPTVIVAVKSLPSPPVSVRPARSQAQAVVSEDSHAPRRSRTADLVLKKRPSFASLRKLSSRIFRPNTGDHDDPPPPVPQIPANTPTPKPHQPTLRPFHSARSARSSLSVSGGEVSISRPLSSAQVPTLPAVFNVPKIPFVKPAGSPPPRPPRPGSTDWELVSLSRDAGSRMMVQAPNRPRTLTASTASSARSRALTRGESEEVNSRLGLPSGHSSVSTRKSLTFDSPLGTPLAATFPLDPSRPLPFRDSSGNVTGYGRFSAYIKDSEQYSNGTYEDGVDRDDRELGPIELYSTERCVDWTLEKRVSGKPGERGMLFRDRWAGWHFVPDI